MLWWICGVAKNKRQISGSRRCTVLSSIELNGNGTSRLVKLQFYGVVLLRTDSGSDANKPNNLVR